MHKNYRKRESHNYRKILRIVLIISAGLLILCLLGLLGACVRTETKLVKIKPIEPDCACYIKTNQDLAECLIKYQEAIKN